LPIDILLNIPPAGVSTPPALRATRMAPAFDKCPTRPAHIDAILNGLDRYNPETTTIFQDYLSSQCEEKTFDAYACLALLKLYVQDQLPQPQSLSAAAWRMLAQMRNKHKHKMMNKK